jgi:spore coat polysaccharide biosynthesis protein SpsF
MNIVAIIQARMGSTRLPGKVLLDLAGEPMLVRVVARTRRAKLIDEVVVATTSQPGDEAIEQLCKSRGWPYCRGSEADVLERFYQAAVAHQADVIVRITSDCPMIEPRIVDRVVHEFLDRQPVVDYASNVLLRRTFPRGLDTEVIRYGALERAWREDANPAWREHVTPYIHRHPELFGLYNVTTEPNLSHMRWTVDTSADLAFVRRVYDYFGHDRFSWQEVLVLLAKHPAWLSINRTVKQKVI